jgi:two-component system, NarL family, nitrate/nitrite response regulator NarL
MPGRSGGGRAYPIGQSNRAPLTRAVGRPTFLRLLPNPSVDRRSSLEPVRVLVLSDDPLVSAGLARLLEEGGDALVVADPAEAEVALVDAGRAGEPERSGRGLDLLGELAVAAVALVGDEEDAALALAAGARGAVLRSTDPAALWAALVAARAGLTVLDGAFSTAAAPPASPVGSAIASARAGAGRGAELTAREREVLSLLSRGLSNKQIAQRLAISDHTAKFHVNGILGKLGAATRTEAVVIAARQGLVAL